jgi:hypothetical protein
MSFDPRSATGTVFLTSEQHITGVSGACFLFRSDNVALTAAHCVPNDANSVGVQLPWQPASQPVERIVRHPDGDLAALFLHAETDDGVGYPTHAFWDAVGNWTPGEEFFAYGSPVGGPAGFPVGGPASGSRPRWFGWGLDAPDPTPRLLVGNYQRFFRYRSPNGMHYVAGEMSIPAPEGLRGAPLFRRAAPQMVTGLATANLESYTITDSIDDVWEGILRDDQERHVRHYREPSKRIISYGLALMLSTVDDWLNEHIPHRKGTAWNP